jgi:hypothetical protein
MAAKLGPAHDVMMSEAHRAKIRNSSILNALIEHAEGSREMSSTQVTAALGLLKKALPDLTAVTMSGDPNAPLITKVVREIVRTPDKDSAGI